MGARRGPAPLSQAHPSGYADPNADRDVGGGITERIALVGGGLIGQAWAIVFGRAGHEVVLYDAEPAALDRARGAIGARLDDLAGFGLVDDPQAVIGRIGYATLLAVALEGAAYVQESTPERGELTRGVYAELDRLAAPGSILA